MRNDPSIGVLLVVVDITNMSPVGVKLLEELISVRATEDDLHLFHNHHSIQ